MSHNPSKASQVWKIYVNVNLWIKVKNFIPTYVMLITYINLWIRVKNYIGWDESFPWE